MRIFITGATGYIGNAVAKALARAGHEVIGLARSEEAARALAQAGIRPHAGDLKNLDTILAGATAADGIIHTASAHDLSGLNAEPVLVRALTDVLAGTGKLFIFTSGTGVLGNTGDRVMTEDDPFEPFPVLMPRVEAERLTVQAAARGVRAVVLRPPTVFGYGGGMLIPKWLLDGARASGQSWYVEGAGDNKWSAVHLDDLVDLYRRVVESDIGGELFHTSAESGIRTRRIAEAVSQAAGLGGKTVTVSLDVARERLGPFGDYWANNSQSSADKARAKLGWAPSGPALLDDIVQGSYARRP